MTSQDQNYLDEIIYARVLITLQRMQLDSKDRKLRERLQELLGDRPDQAALCQQALNRAWTRASSSMSTEAAGGPSLPTIDSIEKAA